MNTVILIPARYASSRYPGKPLVELKGVNGAPKPLIQRIVDERPSSSTTKIAVIRCSSNKVSAASKRRGGCEEYPAFSSSPTTNASPMRASPPASA
jgi:3-deoxy-manno-octulosonate cytidylyltransferase (CMP-KDO synthetase)